MGASMQPSRCVRARALRLPRFQRTQRESWSRHSHRTRARETTLPDRPEPIRVATSLLNVTPVRKKLFDALRSLTARGVVRESEVLRVLPNFQDRRDDLPGSFHGVPPCEERLVPQHRVADEALICGRRLNAKSATVTKVHEDAANMLGRSRNLRFESHRDAFVRLDFDDENVWLDVVGGLAVEAMRDRFEGYSYLRQLARQPLAGAQVEWNAGPAPIFDGESQCGERFGVGVWRDVLLLPVAFHGASVDHSWAVLSACGYRKNVRMRRRLNRREHFVLFTADVVGAGTDRRLHRDER